MKQTFIQLVWKLALYSFALFNFFLYLGLSIQSGAFFKKNTEKDDLQLAIARDRFWNLSKTVVGLSHRFYTLRNGLKLHYLINYRPTHEVNPSKPLFIFLHGFPDSSVLWRYILQNNKLQENATLIAVDLPGYGGSDSFKRYGPVQVLEALAEFIIAMREKILYMEDVDSNHAQGNDLPSSPGKVYIVGHDWGCVLAYRLAAEAPCLADRYILSNGLLVSLALDNKDRILTSSRKMFDTFLHAPLANRSCLSNAINALRPLAFQTLLFGYIAAFQLPGVMVKYLGTGGNYAFLRGAQENAHGKDKSEYVYADSMACTVGPGVNECKTQTSEQEKGQQYGESVLHRAQNPGTFFIQQTAYYRDGLVTQKWDKSLHTVAALYNIQADLDEQRAKFKGSSAQLREHRSSSSSSTLFEGPYKGALKAPATIVWGQRDPACTQQICLDGIGDYVSLDSQVVLLPRTGHWTPVEKESRVAFQAVLEWLVDGGDEMEGDGGDVGMVVKRDYPDSKVLVRK